MSETREITDDLPRWLSWARALVSREFAIIAALLGVVLGIWAFAEVADSVTEGETQTWDEWVLQSLREQGQPNDPLGPAWLENAGRDVTALGSTAVVVLVVAGVSGFFALGRRWKPMIVLIFTAAAGAGVAYLLKDIYQRERPSIVEHFDKVQTYSFPSAHAMIASIVYITLGAYLAYYNRTSKRLSAYFLGLAVLLSVAVGISRMYVGVHYPSDVLAGWAAGLAWACLCLGVVHLISQRRRSSGSLEA
jgi:undecaprenyl-diphosphatase